VDNRITTAEGRGPLGCSTVTHEIGEIPDHGLAAALPDQRGRTLGTSQRQDRVTLAHEPAHQVLTNESTAAGDEHSHQNSYHYK
jgi:hypothetical protein